MDYFQSEIVNNGLKYPAMPIYSILSDTPKFNMDNISQWLKTHKLRNIFIVCNGQQLSPAATERSSQIYGKNFTGIQIIGKRVYSIHRHGNFAATLYDTYGRESLIIDILDTRFNWASGILETTVSLNLIFELLCTILGFTEADPKIILVGYSRGGPFALSLAEGLSNVTDKRYVIAIDPVTANWKREVIGTKPFPVIKNPGCPVWNVFQRSSFLASFDYANYPIGSAVEGASPLGRESSYSWELLDQQDRFCKSHQEMRDKYLPAALKVIKGIV